MIFLSYDFSRYRKALRAKNYLIYYISFIIFFRYKEKMLRNYTRAKNANDTVTKSSLCSQRAI